MQPSLANPFNKSALDEAVTHRTPKMALLQEVTARLMQALPAPDAVAINNVQIQARVEVLPVARKQIAQMAWQSDTVRYSIRDMWRPRRNMLRVKARIGMKRILQAWKACTLFYKAYKSFRKAASRPERPSSLAI